MSLVPAGRRSHSLIWDGWLLLLFFSEALCVVCRVMAQAARRGDGCCCLPGAEFFSGLSELRRSS